MAAQYEVIVPFDLVDKSNGEVKHYKIGDPYDGPTDDERIKRYLAGVDSKGPLIRDKAAQAAEEKAQKETEEQAKKDAARPADSSTPSTKGK